MESQNHLAAINNTLNGLIQRFDAMEARQDFSDARFEKLYRDFVDKYDIGAHPPFNKMASHISLMKSNQVVLKLQSFHEQKVRVQEKVDEFFSQYRPRSKPKSDPCLRPKLAKCKKVRNKHHNDKQREASVPILGFQSLLPATRLLLDSICIQGSAFFVSNVQKSNCTNYGYERVDSVKERFKSPDFSISDGIAIDFSISFNVGFILDAKQMLIPPEVVGVHLGHNVFDELPHSTNNCVLRLGYHMPISDSGGTLIIGHFTSKFQVADVYNSKILVCNVEFLQNGTTDLRHYIELVASNFGDKESDESKIMAVGLYQFMKAQPTILENKCQKEWVGMYAHHLFVGMQQTADMASLKLGFHEFIRDKGGTTFLFSFESIDLLASCKDSCFCVVIDRSMCYNHKGIRDKGGSFSQWLFISKSTNQDCVLGSDCSKVIKCEVSFDSSVIIDGEDAGKLGLHQLEACMDQNRKHERRFTLSRFGHGCCVVCSVVLDRDYYKGIRDKGGGSKFRNVAVGNELFLETYNGSFLRTTFPAVQNVQSAPIKAGLSNQVKVTALQSATVYASCGDFRTYIHDYMTQIVKFLSDRGCPFTVNIYPFISLYNDSNFPVDYAFFDGDASPITDGSATYYNMFGANYDILVWTLQKNGFGNLPIIVEIGWPTKGDRNANLVYAQRFNQGFMSHILSGRGTPMRPGPIDAYPFSLIDKNAKSIVPGHFERHWGIFTFDGLAKYQLNLGSTNSEVLVPAKDCTSLGYGTSCGILDGRGNISYTVNIYYQRNNQLDDVCKIPNPSMITETTPSVGSCRKEIWASPKASEPGCTFEPVLMGFQEYNHGFAGWRDRVEHLFADMHFQKLISQRSFGFVSSSTCKGWVKRFNIAVIMLIKGQHYFQIRFCRYECSVSVTNDLVNIIAQFWRGCNVELMFSALSSWWKHRLMVSLVQYIYCCSFTRDKHTSLRTTCGSILLQQINGNVAAIYYWLMSLIVSRSTYSSWIHCQIIIKRMLLEFSKLNLEDKVDF